MYLSTAGLSGAVVVAMFLLTPADVQIGRLGVFLIAIVVIAGTLPYRKGIAIAIEYLIEQQRRTGEVVAPDVPIPRSGRV